MDLHHIVGVVAQCVQPGSATRRQLGSRLDDLQRAVSMHQAGGMDGSALLSSVTLAFIQLQTTGRISDTEREKTLGCVLTALTPPAGQRLQHVHPAVIDHLTRHLTGVFTPTVPGNTQPLQTALPEPTRLLALQCWRRMTQAVATVHNGGTLRGYWTASLPQDYLALVVCALLDTAEQAEDAELRREALQTLAEAVRTGGVFADAERLQRVFPGVASALARVALAQPKPAAASSEATVRKPPASVRALAMDALRHTMRTLYSGEPGDTSTPGGADAWVGRVALAAQSIIQSGAHDTQAQAQALDQLDRVLWRLAGLRHSEHPAVVSAVQRLFGCIALDCPALQNTPAAAVAVETLLVVSMQNGGGGGGEDAKQDRMWLARLRAAAQQGSAPGAGLARACGTAQRQFERHVDGASDDKRRDAVSLLAAVLAALPDASPLAAWWRARGLPCLLRALHVQLPGTATALLLTGPAEASDAGYVLRGFRTPQLRRVLDAVIREAAAAFGVQSVRAHVLEALDEAPGDAELRAAGLWMLAHEALVLQADGASSAAALEYAGTCVASPHPLVSCVALRAVASLAPQCGSAVAYTLEPLLFPLLLHSALPPDSPASSVQRAYAGRALHALAGACGADSVPAMLRQNIDYIVDAGARQVRAAQVRPEAFSVLAAAVRLMGGAFLVYAEDVVEDALDVCERLAALPADQGEPVGVAALGFLEDVTRVVAEVETQKPGRSVVPLAPLVLAEDPVARVVRELRDLDENARMAEYFDLPDESDDEDKDQPDGPSTDDPAATKHNLSSSPTPDEPPGSPLAVKIALVVQNLLTSPSNAQQLLALKITQHTIRALQHTKDLLPLINHIWPTLVHRVSVHQAHEAFYVAAAACDVIDLVCSAGEAWMRRRVRDDLWAQFAAILRAPGDPGRLSPSERLLCSRVLRAMATVAACVPLERNDAWVACCLPLRFVGVSEMREDAVGLLRAMVPAYGDCLWLVLASLGRTSIDPADIPALPLVPSAQPVASLPTDICHILGL